MVVEKNRHGQTEGTLGLFFDPKSMQYKTRNDKQMLPPWNIE